MTETDSTNRPLQMPEKFLPRLEKYRVYLMLKDMIRNVIIHLPKDHLKQMKIFATHHVYTSEASRLMMLIEPELNIDVQGVVKQLIKDFGCLVITRRCVMDRYEKHDDYVPGCVSTTLMSEVTKNLCLKEPVPQAGWLMFANLSAGERHFYFIQNEDNSSPHYFLSGMVLYPPYHQEYGQGYGWSVMEKSIDPVDFQADEVTDHPCTFREARCLQQDGVLPTVTLVLMRTPTVASHAVSNHTAPRNFFQQDFEGLKLAFKATIKEIHINPEDDLEVITKKCFNAVRAMNAGHQGPKQGYNVVGAPGVYRVLLLGPRGSGRSSQAVALAKHFGLVFVHFDAVFKEAAARDDDIGERIRKYGTSIALRAEVVKNRLLRKDCIDHGWVMTGYPTNANDFDLLDSMSTPPNRIIILDTDVETCRKRTQDEGFDLCTGKTVPMGSGPRVVRHPDHDSVRRDYEWDLYFTEQLAELRASAGLTAVEIDGTEPFDKIQVKLQAAVMAAPHFDIECCSRLRDVCGE